MKSFGRLFILLAHFSINYIASADLIPSDQLLIENISIRGIVFDIVQDSRGFMWLGTEFGLVRYDGHELVYFEHEPGNPHSLAGNAVQHIVEAPEGYLWVGTMESGLHRFDPKTRKFKRFLHIPGDPGTISHNRIHALCLDNAGNLWIGTDGGGLDRMDLETEKIYHYNKHEALAAGAYASYIYDIHFTQDEQLWVGAQNSLDLYHPQEDTFYHFQEAFLQDTINHVINAIANGSDGLLLGMQSGQLFWFDYENKKFNQWELKNTKEDNFSPGRIWAIHRDLNGRFWVGSSGSLAVFSPAQQGIVEYQTVFQVPWYKAFSVTQSADGSVWAGTNHDLQKISVGPKKLSHYQVFIHRNQQVINSGVKAFANYNAQKVWVGATRGLFLFDRKNNTFNQDTLIAAGLHQISKKDIVTLFGDSEDGLWISTVIDFNRAFELFRLNLKTMELRDFSLHIDAFHKSPTSSITEDKAGNIWLGTGLGLAHYNVENDSFLVYENDPDDNFSIPDNTVQKVFTDSQGRLWVGFNQGGLVRFDPTTLQFIKVDKAHVPTPVPFERVRDITEDRKGNIWIGTNGGLHCLNPTTLQITSYTKQQGLPDNTISNILADEAGNIWIGTHNGFSRFNTVTQTFNNFTEKEGRQHREYWDRSCLLNSDGYMYFGGTRGINYFHPDSVLHAAEFPKVYITGFALFNSAVQPNDSSELLQQEISYASDIRLAYNQNVFSFHYSALNYQYPDKIRFTYQMEGFDEEWQFAGAKREVTYTNLDPGSYTFRVKASNENGDWSTEFASLNVRIVGPWWQSWWAYSLYGLLALGFIMGIRRYEIRQIKLRQKSVHLMELDTLKMRFFANISHEFRTPLTLIQGPAQHIFEESGDEAVKQNTKIILRNSNRLLNLVNQLLDISKLEAGKMRLQAREIDLVGLFRHLASSYDSMIADKNIQYAFIPETSRLMVYVDQEKMEKVIHNLLSNAFKFTPEGGHITLHLFTDKKWAHIKVSDTGPGIPSDQLENVFDRFYQLDNSTTRAHEGSGLGMALAKELVALHHGSISVESEQGKGTTFTVKLPMGKSHLSKDEIADKEEQVSYKTSVQDSSDNSTAIALHPDEHARETKEAPILLIVEDNADMRQYIGKTLREQYQIIEAKDGKEGMLKASEFLPDLIISDVMMPEMDGFRLCNLVKSQELTAHIPIILLTAKVDRQSKLSGLQIGADDYLPKPFDAEELLLIVRNRIEERRKMQKKFSQEMHLGLQPTTFTSLDKKFLKKVNGTIEQYLDDDKFNIEALSQEVGLSRVQLYRKIKALTDKSPNHLLRSIRLKRAAEMLRAKTDNISQIAYSVGFNSLSYFNKCFKEEFGMTPTEYEKANHQ